MSGTTIITLTNLSAHLQGLKESGSHMVLLSAPKFNKLEMQKGKSGASTWAQASLKLFLDPSKRSELPDPCAARILEQGNV
jgi:hypothetical protein